MATQLTNYQCPACTGPLHFDGASGKLVCDFCGSSYDTAEIEALYAEKKPLPKPRHRINKHRRQTPSGAKTRPPDCAAIPARPAAQS